jgi:response regulator of citrate/malate metabolism
MEIALMKTKTDFSTKPYNRCLFCPHRIEKRCDGARSSAMELPRWCEYMHDMKEANGLTNAYIAEASGVSLKTIDRIMAMKCDQDIMRETARRIENAIIGSSNQYPCILAYEESAPNAANRLSETMQELEYTRTEIKTVRDEAQRKIDHLLKQVDRLRLEVDYLRQENERIWKMAERQK